MMELITESINQTTFLIETPKDLSDKFESHNNDYIVNVESPYGDGYSSVKICNILEKIM
jgi:hypothetical protein